MKRYIKSSEYDISLSDIQIQSIVFVDDAFAYDPKDDYVNDVYASHKIDYSKLSIEQLNQLSKKELAQIDDINVLRKLDKSKLTLNQIRNITQANISDRVTLNAKQRSEIISKLQDCDNIYIKPRQKNNDFRSMIRSLGGKIRDEDILNIIHSLNYTDCKYGKYSYDNDTWNTILAVFKYDRSYTFSPIKEDSEPVTIDPLYLYIKIDIDHKTDEGYVAISFHEDESKVNNKGDK